MSDNINSKPVTKYVVLKVTYNSYYMESPETWDWNEIVRFSGAVGPDENVEVIRVSDSPPRKEF